MTAPSLQPGRGVDGERIAYLTPQQENRLLASCSQWATLAMLLLCGTRMRTSEALRLGSGDVVVFGGPSRLAYHGIEPLPDGAHPLTGRRRINLTFRRAL